MTLYMPPQLIMSGNANVVLGTGAAGAVREYPIALLNGAERCTLYWVNSTTIGIKPGVTTNKTTGQFAIFEHVVTKAITSNWVAGTG